MEKNLPDILPIFPLSGALVLPGGQLPLNVFEPRYLTMVEDALGQGRYIGMIQPRGDTPQPTPDSIDLYDIGCMGKITEFREMNDGRFLIALTGVQRFKILSEIPIERGYRRALVDWAPYRIDAGEDKSVLDREALIAALQDFLDLAGPDQIEVNWKTLEDAPDEDLVNALSMLGPFEVREKQALLEALTISERAQVLMAIMSMTARGGEDGSSGHA